MADDVMDALDLDRLLNQHPADIAAALPSLDRAVAVELLHRLYLQKKAGPTLREMTPVSAAELFSKIDEPEAATIVGRMAPDDAVDILGKLPEKISRDILGRLDQKLAASLRDLMQYSPETAGGMMTPDVVAISADLTSEEAIRRLREVAATTESVNYVYAVDAGNRLLGVIVLRDLILARPEKRIRDIMRPEVVSLPSSMPQEDVAHMFDKHHYMALPVVDSEGRLLGAVTVDDVIDVLREETTEDILRMSGIPSGEEHPLEAPRSSIKKRLPWMMLNMLLNLVAVSSVALFESTIAQLAFLAVLMPIISDMGGNVANQAMAVIIRGMAVGQVKWEQLGMVVRKEFRVGVINGLVLGIQLSIITWIWRGNVWLGLVVACALWLNTMVSTIIGATFPFLAKRMGLDPAMMSASVVTTITDLTGFFLFLGMATAVLRFVL